MPTHFMQQGGDSVGSCLERSSAITLSVIIVSLLLPVDWRVAALICSFTLGLVAGIFLGTKASVLKEAAAEAEKRKQEARS